MNDKEPPHIPDTPGLRWRWRNSWEAIWRARADIVKKGFRPKNKLLWKGNRALTDYETKKLQDECQSLQSEMLTHARGGIPDGTYDGTLASLIHCYRIECSNGSSACDHRVNDLDRRRLSHVISFRFE